MLAVSSEMFAHSQHESPVCGFPLLCPYITYYRMNITLCRFIRYFNTLPSVSKHVCSSSGAVSNFLSAPAAPFFSQAMRWNIHMLKGALSTCLDMENPRGCACVHILLSSERTEKVRHLILAWNSCQISCLLYPKSVIILLWKHLPLGNQERILCIFLTDRKQQIEFMSGTLELNGIKLFQGKKNNCKG